MRTIKYILILAVALLPLQGFCSITLQKNQVVIVNQAGDSKPIQRAIASLQNDMEKVMGFRPEVTTAEAAPNDKVKLFITNDEAGLEGDESHEVYVDEQQNSIVLHGHDLRGTIFAIYTFTEQVLGVPPLWYFCGWQPVRRSAITTGIRFHADAPQVRFRAWFPNDTDLLTPWHKEDAGHEAMWFETMLRLKLNCVELETTVTYPDYKMSEEAQQVSDMGIILTSHHHVALNNSFTRWNEYWREVRHREPPKPSIHRLLDLIEFWRYNAETVHRSGIENLWQVTFRGRGDQPFWAFFDDAPESDEERGQVITQMMQIQLDIIREVTGEDDPYVRTTFYDEMSNLLAKGYIRPPKGKNMIWTYVAARRDHYPNDDVVQFDSSLGVKLGYYFNYQFTSTGSHLAACEGPWKMEFNYRYVNSKCPLLFSVVNAGNVREHLTELAANARMMWSYDQYDTDTWLRDYCAQYFGQKNAARVAQLYRDYYNAYWQPKPTEFPGLKSRQFNFQDMRYARAMDQILRKFWKYTDNPLQDIGYESVKGRSFRIQGTNQVDTLIRNMALTAQRFDRVAVQARKLSGSIPSAQRTWYNDNLQAPATFMAHLSHSLHEFMLAYKGQRLRVGASAGMQDKAYVRQHITVALCEMEQAKAALYATHHGVFSDWYTHDRLFGIEGKIRGMKRILEEAK